MRKFLSFFAVVFSVMAFAQQQGGKLRKVAAVGFLNVENLWDTIRSADYIDGTKDIKNPAFHRSISLDSIKFLEAEKYDGTWSDTALKGKKAVRYQSGSEEFT
ncbi:MAG: endonuclease, partial [Chryseobacterium sp.]